MKKFSKEYYEKFKEIYHKHLQYLKEELESEGFNDYISLSFAIYNADNRKMCGGTSDIINPELPQSQ